MEKIKRLLFLGLLVFFAAACGGKSDTPTPVVVVTPPVKPVPPNPGGTTLMAPANNQPCESGTAVSATQSTVTFSWTKADNTDIYQVHIKNLLTQDTIIRNTAQLTLTVTLLKSTPYEWYVITTENNVTYQVTSDTWKFFNSGPGVAAYPPYPADLISPIAEAEVATPATGKVTLKWKATPGSAAIKNYDVYLGSPSPVLSASAVTATTIDIPVVPGNIYYWNIVTRDVNGNTSTSETYSFFPF